VFIDLFTKIQSVYTCTNSMCGAVPCRIREALRTIIWAVNPSSFFLNAVRYNKPFETCSWFQNTGVGWLPSEVFSHTWQELQLANILLSGRYHSILTTCSHGNIFDEILDKLTVRPSWIHTPVSKWGDMLPTTVFKQNHSLAITFRLIRLEHNTVVIVYSIQPYWKYPFSHL